MKKLLPILSLFIFFSCHKEEVVRSSELDAPLVTGFNLIDNRGLPFGNVGSPNVKTRVFENNIRIDMVVYPNPTNGRINVNLGRLSSTKTHIWVTPARLDQSLLQFNFATSQAAVIGGHPILKLENVSPQNTSVQLDLSGFPSGAYRVYVQFDQILLWDNILLQK